jgi:uncharacterized Zn finger protein
MALYDYKCSDCGIVQEKSFKMSEKPSEIIEECINCGNISNFYPCPSAPNIGYMVSTKRVSSDFRNRLDQIKKEHPKMNATI